MRRLFIYLIVAIVVIGALRAMHHRPARYAPPPVRWHHRPAPHDDGARREVVAAEQARRQAQQATAEARRQAQQAAAEARRALVEAGRDLREAYREARDEVSRAYREARDELHRAYREVVADRGGRPPLPPPPLPPPAEAPALEEADGLPVPIVPGTRVTEAEARPPVPAAPPVPARLASQGQAARDQAAASQAEVCEINEGTQFCIQRAAVRAQNHRAVPGDICANEDRARADARKALRIQVLEWLSPDVPASWTPPAGLLEAMVVGTKIDPLVKDYGTLYKAELTADFSPMHRAGLVDEYNRELINRRLMTLGGTLGFVLICLAAVSGYIRADEATKGYYTNRLRMLAAAGVGAAGVIVYRLVA
jgi:hypothetical protein